MAQTSLLPEFAEGFQARIDAGRCFEHELAACRYYASSHCADAWHAGFAHACNAMAGNTACRPQIRKVWHGRGYLVNVQTENGRLSYLVNYDRAGPALAGLVS